MAHEVIMAVPEQELGSSLLVLRVKWDGRLLGTLQVSKGGVTCFRPNSRRARTTTWASFTRLLEQSEE